MKWGSLLPYIFTLKRSSLDADAVAYFCDGVSG